MRPVFWRERCCVEYCGRFLLLQLRLQDGEGLEEAMSGGRRGAFSQVEAERWLLGSERLQGGFTEVKRLPRGVVGAERGWV